MFDWLTKPIKFFVEVVKSAWEFVTGIIENTMKLIEYLGMVTEVCYDAIASMPDWLQAFATLTITVSVLFMILGRQTGGKKQ